MCSVCKFGRSVCCSRPSGAGRSSCSPTLGRNAGASQPVVQPHLVYMERVRAAGTKQSPHCPPAVESTGTISEHQSVHPAHPFFLWTDRIFTSLQQRQTAARVLSRPASSVAQISAGDRLGERFDTGGKHPNPSGARVEQAQL